MRICVLEFFSYGESHKAKDHLKNSDGQKFTLFFGRSLYSIRDYALRAFHPLPISIGDTAG